MNENMNKIGPNKAIASGGTVPASILIVWVLGQFGIAVSPEVAAAMAGAVAALLTWLVPAGKR